MFDSVNKLDVWALQLRKWTIPKNLFYKTENLVIEFKFCAQTRGK